MAISKNDIIELPADNSGKLRLGWRVREEVGIVIINDYTISHLIIPTEIVEDTIIDMSHLFDDISNRFGLMEI